MLHKTMGYYFVNSTLSSLSINTSKENNQSLQI